jgi:hypothetical protein
MKSGEIGPYLAEKLKADRNAKYETTTSRGVLGRKVGGDCYNHLARYVAELRWEHGMKDWEQLETAMLCVSLLLFPLIDASFRSLAESGLYPISPSCNSSSSSTFSLRSTLVSSDESERYIAEAVKNVNRTRELFWTRTRVKIDSSGNKTGVETELTEDDVRVFPSFEHWRNDRHPTHRERQERMKKDADPEADARAESAQLRMLSVPFCSSDLLFSACLAPDY